MTKKTRAKARRALLTLSLVLVMMMVAIGGTIAWLTDSTETITNTFTASDVTVTLEESKKLDLKMVPGSDITKDPVATIVDGSEDSYLFVEITKNATYDDYLNDYAVNKAADWKLLKEDGLVAIYYKDDAVVGTGYAVLEGDKVTVSTEVTKTMMENVSNGTTTAPALSFKAYACQKANVNSAADAWKYIQNNGLTPENP